MDVKVDGATTDRATTSVLTAVQLTNPAATSNTVYLGALKVGLNRICSPYRAVTAAMISGEAGVGVTIVALDYDEFDNERADALASSLGLAPDVVVSAAVRTGMAMLAGEDATKKAVI